MAGTLANETTRTQKAVIRAYLLENGVITKPIALAICDCDRLGARIWDLRHDNDDPMDITTDYRLSKNRYGHTVKTAVYRLKLTEDRTNG